MIDVALLEPGIPDYNLLNTSYVIMIMTFDLFGYGRYQYTFRAACKEESECLLDDGAVRIFLNTRGTNDDEVSKELVDFLHYIENTTDEAVNNMDSERIRRIHERVRKVKASEEVGVRYMQAWEENYYDKEEAREEGRLEGHAAGLREGRLEGHVAGLREGIRALVLDNLEDGNSHERIVEKLMRRFSLTEEEAASYVEKYGGK